MTAVRIWDASARTVAGLEESFLKLFRQRDAARLAAGFYTAGARLHAARQAALTGRAAIAAHWEAQYRSGLVDIRREPDSSELVEGLAYSAGRYVLTFETLPGMLHREQGHYLTVFQRQPDESWLAVAESWLPEE